MEKPDFQYIDIHTHLNFAAFDADREEVIARMKEEGVYAINVGTQKETSALAVELARKYDNCFATVGIHPVHTERSWHDSQEIGGGEGEGFYSRTESFDHEYFRDLVSDSKVVAIGETGLDYYRMQTDADTTQTDTERSVERQKEIFRQHIELANEAGKPLMLHIRNSPNDSEETPSAYRDSLEILRKKAKVPMNVHFFAGTIEEARAFIELGGMISFTGVITFARQYEKLIKALPLESIMAETDAPYVAPATHRGERNEPLYVKEVYAKIARIKRMEEEEVREVINANARRFFFSDPR